MQGIFIYSKDNVRKVEGIYKPIVFQSPFVTGDKSLKKTQIQFIQMPFLSSPINCLDNVIKTKPRYISLLIIIHIIKYLLYLTL